MSRIWDPLLGLLFRVSLSCLGSFLRLLPGRQQSFPSECQLLGPPCGHSCGDPGLACHAHCCPALLHTPSCIRLPTSIPQSFQRTVLHFVPHFSCFLLEDWFIRTVSLLEMKPWKLVLTFRIISQPENQRKSLFYFQMQPAPLQLPVSLCLLFLLWHFIAGLQKGPGSALNMLSGDA